MKKWWVLLLFTGGVYSSCVVDPQAKGDEHVMQWERETNPIAYQTEVIDSVPDAVVPDSSRKVVSPENVMKK